MVSDDNYIVNGKSRLAALKAHFIALVNLTHSVEYVTYVDRQHKVGEIEPKRMKTESNCNNKEGTMKFEAIDGGFTNEVLNVWFSHFMKNLSIILCRAIICLFAIDRSFITVVYD